MKKVLNHVLSSIKKKSSVSGGSSDDGLDGRRSAQSTPRLKRGQQVQGQGLNNDQGRSYGSLSNVQVHRVNNTQQQRHRDHSLDPDLAYRCRDPSLEHVDQGTQQRQLLNRSWDCDRVLGLDRCWEAERAKGIELLYRSMEREKQREKEKERLHGKERHDNRHHDSRGRSRHRRHKHKSRHRTAPAPPSGDTCEHWVMGGTHRDPLNLEILEPTPTLVEQGPNSPDSNRGRLEREVEDLNQQLVEEKEKHRRDKIQVAKLQREVSRHKSDGPLRENLMKELDRERMLRADAEQRLKDMTYESDTTKERLMALQNEFKKMEEMVRSMVSYKHKIDALKQEKSNLITSYEASVAKYQSHVKNLDRENRILLAEIKKLQSQTPSPSPSNEDLSYRVTKPSSSRSSEEAESKTKVLLERLKMLEAENSALVLENETQRQQYEKCLDSIANQVVQALLTQKGLREECGKLQKRVIDLEQQNKQLNQMFQQRIRFASDSLLQSALAKINSSKSSGSGSNSSSACRSPGGSSGGSHTSLNLQQQLAALTEMVSEGGALSRPGGEQAASACSFDSIFSLQSLCSDYNDQSQCEESLGKPEMSSPPPWLREKISFPFKTPLPSSNLSESSRSSLDNPNKESSLTASDERTPEGASEKASSPKDMLIGHEYSSELETEFPANNASPKMKHVFYDRHGKQVSLDVATAQPEVKSDVSKSKNLSLNERDLKLEGDGKADSKDQSLPDPQKTKNSPESECDNQDDGKSSNAKTLKCKVCEKRPSTSEMGLCLPCGLSKSLSPGQELLRLTDSFNEKFIVNEQDGLPQIQPRPAIDLSSDEDTSSSRAVSHTFSAASTVSLNELLERELDEMETPKEEGFSFDNLPIFESIQAKLEMQENKTVLPGVEGTNVPDQEALEEPVRDNDPERSESKLSKSSSQSESSILSQRPMRVSGSKQGVLSGETSRDTSPSIRRPSSLSLSQEGLINTDSEPEPEEPVKAASSSDCTKLKSKTSSPSKMKKSSSHKDELTSPKHKGKLSCAKSACSMEPHPLKLYNVISPPGEHESILEKFKKQPPKVKPKPSIAMCLKKNSRDDDDEDEVIRMKPYSKRPETDGQECSPKESYRCEFKQTKPSQVAGKCEQQSVEKVNQKNENSEATECPGAREQNEVSDQMTVSSSSGSPDSAMQQSFSSSSSDNTLSDKPSCRDDGYLSNSTISMSSNDIPGDLIVTQFGVVKQQGQVQGNIKRRSKAVSAQPLSEAAQQIRRRSQPQCGSGEPHYENTNMNANPTQKKAHRFELASDKSKSLPPGMKLGRVFSRDSSSSMESASSIENNSIGKVRDIKAFFEGKVDEKLKSRLLEMELDKNNAASDRENKSCEISSQSEGRKDFENAQGHIAKPYDLRRVGALEKCHSEEGLLVSRSPNMWQPASSDCLRTKPIPPPKPSRKKKPVFSRLRRSRSDTTLYQCMSEIHREDNKAIHIALRRDWMKFCSSLTSQKRAQSLPLNKDASIRKRSVSPRLLPRRSQRHHSQEVMRSHGEGSETRSQSKGRPEVIGCAGPFQMAASYPCESSPSRHWGRPRRHHSTEKNLVGWSSDSDDGSDSGLSGSRQGEREGPSALLPEWGSGGQFSHQALGIRRFDKSNNASKHLPPYSVNLLSPPGGRPQATSPTGGVNVSPYKLNNQKVYVGRRQPGTPPRTNVETRVDHKKSAEAVFNRCYQRGEVGKGDGNRVSHTNIMLDKNEASPDCEGRLGEDLAGLGQSLEEFEREYTEMFQTQIKGANNSTLHDISNETGRNSCNSLDEVRDIAFRVPKSLSPTEQEVQSRSPDCMDGNVRDNKLAYEQGLIVERVDLEKTEIKQLSKEDNDEELSERKIIEESEDPDKMNKNKMIPECKEKGKVLSKDDKGEIFDPDIKNISLRECNIRDSLLSLDSLNTSEDLNTDHEGLSRHHFDYHTDTRKEGMADLMSEDRENVDSDGSTSTESETEMLTAEKRAEMLDTLVSGFSSGGEEEDDYVYLQEGPESASGAGAGAGAGAATMESPVIAGLHDIADGKHKVRVTPICRTKVDRKTFVRYADPEHHAIKSFEFLDDMSQASSASQSEDDKASKHHKNSKTGSKTKANGKGTFTMRRAGDGGAISPPGDKKGKQSPSDSGKARPLNPKVKSLREESRKEANRLSNSSFDAVTFGSEDFTLSDSCCEDFSSGISDNDSKA